MTISLAQWTVATGPSSGNAYSLPQSTGPGNAAIFISAFGSGGSAGSVASATVGSTSMVLQKSLYANNAKTSIFVLFNIPGGQPTITATVNIGNDGSYAYFEFSGVDAIDVIASAQGNLSNAYNSGTAATNHLAEAWVGTALCTATGGAVTMGVPGAPWTAATANVNAFNNAQAAGYQIASSMGNMIFNGTASGGTSVFSAAAIALYRTYSQHRSPIPIYSATL